MSKWIQDASWKRGQKVEEMFKDILKQKTDTVRPSNLTEQFQHVDYFSEMGSIDVKARKRVARKDLEVQDDLVWLEFKNVQGNKGWLYGKADWIAFERLKDFVLVKRAELAHLAESLCDLERRALKGVDALYRGYQRKGRKDLLSIIKMTDVLTLPHQLWPKEGLNT